MRECVIEHTACLLQWLLNFDLFGFLGSYDGLRPPSAFPVICIAVFVIISALEN